MSRPEFATAGSKVVSRHPLTPNIGMEYIVRQAKEVEWIGPARRELREFSLLARREAGRKLRIVQNGLDPDDWKSMESVGPGAREIRIRTFDGGTVQHRVIYVAKFAEAVYVLHAFEKKTAQTPPHHIEVAGVRYRQMLAKRALLDQNRRGLR